MKINNVNNLQYNSPEYNIQIGKTLYAKILSNDKGRGYIQLPNGQILQAIIQSFPHIESNKFIKFYVENIDDNILLLKAFDTSEINKNDYVDILNRLNIPKEIGKEIIETLVKFNIPANDFYISLVYHYINFFKSLKKLDNNKIISLIKKFTTENITHAEETYKNIGDILNKLKEININHLCFLIENDLDLSIDNIFNLLIYINDIDINEIIDSSEEKFKNKNFDFSSFISKIKFESSNKHLDQLKSLVALKELLEKICVNYEIYYFNYYDNESVLKNSLILKKEKFKKGLDNNNSKLYLRISSEKFGDIDIFIINNLKNLSLKFLVNKEFKDLFLINIGDLVNKLKIKEFKNVLVKINEKSNNISIVDLNNFFIDNIVELDVKV
ncbi:MAG: hypothetical protein N2486_01695 [Caloramator sp.]|nr:hypothetical protein [Caloramator sp.]